MIEERINPDQPNATTWAVICNHCAATMPLTHANKWLFTDPELNFDFHLCPACTDTAAQGLLRTVLPAPCGRFARLAHRLRHPKA